MRLSGSCMGAIGQLVAFVTLPGR